MSAQKKIKKARQGTLNPANRQNKPSGESVFKPQISKENQEALQEIQKQMEASVEAPAPSETPSIPETEQLDDLFKNNPMPPSIKIASVARRKTIEAASSELRIDQLFVSGELTQRVVIRPGRLEITFRTLKGREDLYIKRRLSDVKNEVARYAEDRFLYMMLAAHIKEYNGKEFPTLVNAKGEIDDQLFDERFNAVCDIPQLLMEEIWVNFQWFEDRVRRALEAENLGNG